MRTTLVLASLIAMTLPALAEGDPAKGMKVFARCKACHDATEPKNKSGPHLVGLFGRKAGSLIGFKYSDAMVTKGEEGLVWDAASLKAYVMDPRGYIEGNSMGFPGLKKEADADNLVAWFETLPKE